MVKATTPDFLGQFDPSSSDPEWTVLLRSPNIWVFAGRAVPSACNEQLGMENVLRASSSKA